MSYCVLTCADQLRDGAQRFEKKAVKLKRKMWWKNMKVSAQLHEIFIDTNLFEYFVSVLKYYFFGKLLFNFRLCVVTFQFMLILAAIVCILILIIVRKYLMVPLLTSVPFLKQLGISFSCLFVCVIHLCCFS